MSGPDIRLPGFANLLEPPGLVRAFLRHPPRDFRAWLGEDGLPLFAATFDLLTTVEAPLRARLMRLPGYGWWGRWLRPYTCFTGTTVSEYALLPEDASPEAVADALVRDCAGAYPFVIVKDIPDASPLLSEADNRRSRALMDALLARGFIAVEGQALAWRAIDFTSVDDYLSRLSSGRRKDLRRKLKSRARLRVDTVRTGSARFTLADVRAEYYRLYEQVYAQSEIHFDLLTPEFFDEILGDRDNGGVVFEYWRDDTLIGYNLCFVCGDTLVDKYIGLRYPEAREHNLYFVSWFHNLEYALAHGLKRYVAGWTDPEIKAALGADFTFTRHAVHIRQPLLRAVLRRLSHLFESDRAWREGRDAARES